MRSSRSSRRGPDYMVPFCRLVRGAIRVACGDVHGAVDDGRRAVVLARTIGDPQALQPALAFAARAFVAAADHDRANVFADEFGAGWAEVGGTNTESADAAWAFDGLGRADDLRRALERNRRQTPWQGGARLMADGEPERAAEVYAAIGSLPDEAYARLRAALGLVRAGRPAEADRQLRLALPALARL